MTVALCVALGGMVLAPAVILTNNTTALPVPSPPPVALPAPIEMPPVQLELPHEHQEFEDQVAEITGPDARDCGHLDYRTPATTMRAALACGLRAAKSGRPFLVIKSEYGIDSWIPHGLVRGRSGPVLRFSYDDLVPSHTIQTEPCASPAVKWSRDYREWVFACAK